MAATCFWAWTGALTRKGTRCTAPLVFPVRTKCSVTLPASALPCSTSCCARKCPLSKWAAKRSSSCMWRKPSRGKSPSTKKPLVCPLAHSGALAPATSVALTKTCGCCEEKSRSTGWTSACCPMHTWTILTRPRLRFTEKSAPASTRRRKSWHTPTKKCWRRWAQQNVLMAPYAQRLRASCFWASQLHSAAFFQPCELITSAFPATNGWKTLKTASSP